MVLDFHAKHFFYGGFDVLNPWITKLNDFSCVGHNHVIVLFGTVGFFKLGDVFPELVFPHEVTSQQQFYRIVQGSP